MKSFAQLKKNLKKDLSGFKKYKIAVLGDTATQFLVQALQGIAVDGGTTLKVFEADFNQIERQVFDPTSELYEFEPEFVLIFRSTHKLLAKYNKLSPDSCSGFADDEISVASALYANISEKLKARCIFYNYPEIDDAVFGNYSNSLQSSFLYQLRKLNLGLMEFASAHGDFYICDLASIQNTLGRNICFSPSIYVNTEMVLSLDILPIVAERTHALISALKGGVKKCLILDLDNTTWGGIIGDDGLENIQIGSLGIGKAFTEFQYWVKKLKDRGIIICVCSKNTEAVAKEPFEKHPDMVLRLDDIAVFVANWENKADNIRYIQSVLNIGFDSMVFLDDNPFERNIVREHIPEVCVPELPEDPADYLEFLYSQNLFETATFSGEDSKRTKQYQIEAQRAVENKQFANEDDFLSNLEMVSEVKHFDKFSSPRVAQLSQRSNQFNLRTIRYTEAEIEQLYSSENHVTFSFTLKDKFGDSGLICAIILEKEDGKTLFIDTWFMSCRVLKRGMENFVLNTIMEYAKSNNFVRLKGEYIPTQKNALVKDHYADLGFEFSDGYYHIDTEPYGKRKTFIQNK